MVMKEALIFQTSHIDAGPTFLVFDSPGWIMVMEIAQLLIIQINILDEAVNIK